MNNYELDELIDDFACKHSLEDHTTAQFMAKFVLFKQEHGVTTGQLKKWAEDYTTFLSENPSFKANLGVLALIREYA